MKKNFGKSGLSKIITKCVVACMLLYSKGTCSTCIGIFLISWFVSEISQP